MCDTYSRIQKSHSVKHKTPCPLPVNDSSQVLLSQQVGDRWEHLPLCVNDARLPGPVLLLTPTPAETKRDEMGLPNAAHEILIKDLVEISVLM